MRKYLILLLLLLMMLGCSDETQQSLMSDGPRKLVSGDASSTLVIDSQWNAGYCARVMIQNTGSETISDWVVELDVTDAVLYTQWSGTFQLEGSALFVSPAAYNGSIAPGGSVNFGYCANTTPVVLPEIDDLSYNGLTDSDTDAPDSADSDECAPTQEVCDELDNDCDGLIDEADVCEQNPQLLIVVAAPLIEFEVMREALATYQADIAAAGWRSALIAVNNVVHPLADYICSDETVLKGVIAEYYNDGAGIQGLLFVGSAPQIPNAYWAYHRQHGVSVANHLPTDLYYTDMDEWVDIDNNGCYESYDSISDTNEGTWTADLATPANPLNHPYTPELFMGRITAGPFAASLAEEAELAAMYFDKVHDYRQNGSRLTPEQQQRALLFQDDDFTGKGLTELWQHMAPNLVGAYDKSLTTAAYLAAEVQNGYRFVFDAAHSGADAHQTHEWLDGTKLWIGDYSLHLLDTIDVNAEYLHMFNCSANKFSVPNLGGKYLFAHARPLNTTGSTGDWGFMADEQYFIDLAAQTPIGVALFEHIQRNIQAGEQGWAKGTLQGDPLMKYDIDVPNKAPVITNDLTNVTALKDVAFEITFTVADPEGDAVVLQIESELPDGAVFDGQTLYWTPSAVDVGFQSAAFTVLATDAASSTYRETFRISVLDTVAVSGLLNGDFEAGTSTTVDDWTNGAWQTSSFVWEEMGAGMNESRCVSIESSVANDAWWKQTVSGLAVGETYVFSGYAKGENIVNSTGDVAVNFGIDGEYEHSMANVNGTFDWTPIIFLFTATDTSMTLDARLGHWGNTVTGKVWFDNLALYRVVD